MMFTLIYHKREADSKKTLPSFVKTHRGIKHLTLQDLRVGISETLLKTIQWVFSFCVLFMLALPPSSQDETFSQSLKGHIH